MTVFGGSQHFLGTLFVAVSAIFLLIALVFFFCLPKEENEMVELYTGKKSEAEAVPVTTEEDRRDLNDVLAAKA